MPVDSRRLAFCFLPNIAYSSYHNHALIIPTATTPLFFLPRLRPLAIITPLHVCYFYLPSYLTPPEPHHTLPPHPFPLPLRT